MIRAIVELTPQVIDSVPEAAVVILPSKKFVYMIVCNPYQTIPIVRDATVINGEKNRSSCGMNGTNVNKEVNLN